MYLIILKLKVVLGIPIPTYLFQKNIYKYRLYWIFFVSSNLLSILTPKAVLKLKVNSNSIPPLDSYIGLGAAWRLANNLISLLSTSTWMQNHSIQRNTRKNHEN